MAILKGVKDRIDVKVVAECETDNGTTTKVPFVVTFKKPSVTESRDLIERLSDKLDDDGNVILPKITDEELAKEYILGWAGVPTITGEPYEFTPENLAEMMEAREYLAALTRGMNEVLFGREAVIAKNSLRLAGRGR